MPTFSVGADAQIVVTGPYGQLDIDNVTSFSCDPVIKMVSVDLNTGVTESRSQFKQWKGDIMFARGNATIDQLADQMQAAQQAGIAIPDGSILYQITELDGTVTRYQLTKVQYDIKKLGDFKGDNAVDQSLSYVAQLRNPA
jgi:hypothetical protein